MIPILEKWGAKGKIYRSPTGVDENEFYFREEGRNRIRRELGLDGKFVVIYIGKFGDLYYKEEIPGICKSLVDINKNFLFLIVTSNELSGVNTLFEEAGISPDFYHLTSNLSYEEIKEYISAADLGISAVPPSPSQRFRSPTKVAEYLLCGIPYITCDGVSEDFQIAEKYNVGIVLKKFCDQEVKNNYEKIKELLEEDKKIQRERCRNVGIQYRAKSNNDKIFQIIFSEVFD